MLSLFRGISESYGVAVTGASPLFCGVCQGSITVSYVSLDSAVAGNTTFRARDVHVRWSDESHLSADVVLIGRYENHHIRPVLVLSIACSSTGSEEEMARAASSVVRKTFSRIQFLYNDAPARVRLPRTPPPDGTLAERWASTQRKEPGIEYGLEGRTARQWFADTLQGIHNSVVQAALVNITGLLEERTGDGIVINAFSSGCESWEPTTTPVSAARTEVIFSLTDVLTLRDVDGALLSDVPGYIETVTLVCPVGGFWFVYKLHCETRSQTHTTRLRDFSGVSEDLCAAFSVVQPRLLDLVNVVFARIKYTGK